MLDLQNKFSGETHLAFNRARHADNRPSDYAVFSDYVQHERPFSEAASDILRNGLVVANKKKAQSSNRQPWHINASKHQKFYLPSFVNMLYSVIACCCLVSAVM